MLSDDGKKAEFDSPENLKALQFMVDGIKDGAAPKAVTTYMEEEARRAFESGRATFMRNWPYAYAIGKKNKDAPEFEVAPFPEFEGGGKAGILGGHNDVISVYSKNPGGALALVDYLTGGGGPDARRPSTRCRRRSSRPTTTPRSRRRSRSPTSSSRRSSRRSRARSRRSTRRSPRRSTRTSTRRCRADVA